MPLIIELKPHEKIFINGAVIANGAERAHITLLNDATLLREKDILTEEKADTPCKRIYFALQLMYIDPTNTTDYFEFYEKLSKELVEAVPSAAKWIAEINSELVQWSIYPALRAAKKLIEYEEELMKHAQQSA